MDKTDLSFTIGMTLFWMIFFASILLAYLASELNNGE